MKLGSNDIGSVYLGTNAVQKIYLGTNEVWTSFTGLLDTYSGAEAAYSLRLLSSTYTGDAIKVRRSVGTPAETDIGFVNNELDVTTLESFCSGTDGYVVTWYDQSGNGYNATQSSASNQPQIVSSGSVINIGSKPCILSGANLQLTATTSLSTASNMTSFVVHDTQSINGIDGIFNVGDITQNLSQFALTNEYALRYRGGATTYSPTNNENYHLVTAKWNTGNSSTHYIYVNNSSLTQSGSASLANTDNDLYIFNDSGTANSWPDIKLQELIIYPSDQSSNRTGIETNINDFYSIY